MVMLPLHPFPQAFGAWRQACEQQLLDDAAAQRDARLVSTGFASWRAVMARRARKRALAAAAAGAARRSALRRGMVAWMQYTYYKHMGHVARHYRARRIGCLALRTWHQVGLLLLTLCLTSSAVPRAHASQRTVHAPQA